MAEENIKDFTVNWIVTGLLTTCLLMFALTFMYYNNPTGLDKDGTGNKLNVSNYAMSNKLVRIDKDSDLIFNITAETDPEKSELGSRESVAVALETYSKGKSFWKDSISLLSWVFGEEVGKLLIGTIGGIIGFVGIYFTYRFIRGT